MPFSSFFVFYCFVLSTMQSMISQRSPKSITRIHFTVAFPTGQNFVVFGQKDNGTSSKSYHRTNFKFHVISDQGVYWSTQYFNAIFSIQLLSFKRKLLMLAEVGQNFSSLIPGQLEARQCSVMVVVWWEPPSQESMYEYKVILYKSCVELPIYAHLDIFHIFY